jgi:tRNA-specific 2-thiouridylase
MWNLKHLYKIITKPGRGKSVFVGVSGGVDSSVTALLLKLYGYNVTGVFIKTWQPEWIECTWRDERRDAMRVCAHLEIPFIELDLEKEYKQGVADYMIAEYKKGRTPNPDVMCNRKVKFGGFLDYALKQGADYVATGHYAQNINNQLCKGIDESKDQSYFVWTLTDQQLSNILFPVGSLQKKQVRKLAQRYNIPVAAKKDSQGICFIGDIDMKDFLSHYIDKKPGNVVNSAGEIIGTHDGVLFYTIGERHGFVIDKKTTHDKPYYVLEKKIDENILVVSQEIVSNKKAENINLIDCVWRIEPEQEKSYTAQVRYHGEFKPCTIYKKENSYQVLFKETDMTISSGQSVVVYDNHICIGGGIVA